MLISTDKFLEIIKKNYYANTTVMLSKLLDKLEDGLTARAEQIASGEEIIMMGFGLGVGNLALVSLPTEQIREIHDVVFTDPHDLIKAIMH